LLSITSIFIGIVAILIHSRLILIAVSFACKFSDDEYLENQHYAKVGGISLQDFNTIERKFFQMIDCNLCVGKEEYETYLQNLIAHIKTIKPDSNLIDSDGDDESTVDSVTSSIE
jgi:5-bromo-4-chloroindolyl phosphate hydrolysis protein